MDNLPDDIIQYIQSFLVIISWRAEQHYFKLLQRFHTFQYEDVPLYFKTISEHSNYYLYNYNGVAMRAYTWDSEAIEKMKQYYVKQYILPLRDYLTQYRLHKIKSIWNLTSSFQLFGCNINGQMSPYMYKYYLAIRAKHEGFDTYTIARMAKHYSRRDPTLYKMEWQGCLPLTSYRKACVHLQIPTLEY